MRKLPLLVSLLAVAAMAAAFAIPALAATRTVAVKDNFFSPKATTISKGSTVKWVWRGDAAHNVSKSKGPGVKFRSPNKLSGSYSHRFTRAGLYTVICTIHPGMTSTVRVK
jgi:plastocyanin